MNEYLCYLIPIITFFLGHFSSRLTMSKKERKDYQSKLQESSNKFNEARLDKYHNFTKALKTYIDKECSPDFDDFFNISTTGDHYFNQVKILCDSILSKNIDSDSVYNTHLPFIKDTIEKLLPEYYNALQTIAQKNNIKFDGVLKRSNYESIYKVYDKYVV